VSQFRLRTPALVRVSDCCVRQADVPRKRLNAVEVCSTSGPGVIKKSSIHPMHHVAQKRSDMWNDTNDRYPKKVAVIFYLSLEIPHS
jgi:hypothetical protein